MATMRKESSADGCMKQRLCDIISFVTWSELSLEYFGKSTSWFYHKMRGIDGNGRPTDFTEEEKERLRGALCDIAERLRRAASLID